ncbi:TolC family protein [Aliiglaciecola sp. CAU 1673]|uniref:TolC family protein n=1 Tax=Aliiglaciecola sp. CAU 1673 TaxID=3032595 RepID=UPI0023D9B625|nr:TolC family protein [Aliiglaciecola sp. CAU 1673]
MLGIPGAMATQDKPLSLAQALERALQKHPTLSQYPYAMRALEAQRLQAGFVPNPSLELELENMMGSGDSKGFNAAEVTLSFSQLIELGEKRQKRLVLEEKRQAQANSSYERDRLLVLSDTAQAYYQVLGLQAHHQLNETRLAQAKRAFEAIEKRAQGGAVAAADVARMALKVSEVRLQGLRLQEALEQARHHLAQQWLAQPDFTQVLGDINTLPPLPAEAAVMQAVNQAPESLLLAQQIRLQQASLSLEKAQSTADISVSGGLRFHNERNDSSLVLGISMPLPLSDPNRGNVNAALARLDGLAHAEQQLRQSLRSQATALYVQMHSKHRIIAHITQALLPNAQQLLTDSEKGYANGQISVLQLLDAQEQGFEAKRALLDAHLSLLHSLLALQRLTGQQLTTSQLFPGTEHSEFLP